MKPQKYVSGMAIALLVSIGWNAHAAAVNEQSAKKLLSDSGCLSCHDVTQAKVARSYEKIAASYKGNSKAAGKLVKHLTEPGQVELDGEMMDHPKAATSDQKKIKNLVDWILSR